MPSYLATIRLHAESEGRARLLFEAIASGDCVAVQTGLVVTWLMDVRSESDEPSPDAINAVRALSPAVLEELRQMMREVAENEAERVRAESLTWIREHINKSHVQGGYFP